MTQSLSRPDTGSDKDRVRARKVMRHLYSHLRVFDVEGFIHCLSSQELPKAVERIVRSSQECSTHALITTLEELAGVIPTSTLPEVTALDDEALTAKLDCWCSEGLLQFGAGMWWMENKEKGHEALAWLRNLHAID